MYSKAKASYYEITVMNLKWYCELKQWSLAILFHGRYDILFYLYNIDIDLLKLNHL